MHFLTKQTLITVALIEREIKYFAHKSLFLIEYDWLCKKCFHFREKYLLVQFNKWIKFIVSENRDIRNIFRV